MESIRVLLVDDEDDFRTTLANRLRKRKMEVAEAESGRSAINLLKQGTFDVVVLDVRMPGMDGIETLKEIKTNRSPGGGDHAHRPRLGGIGDRRDAPGGL